MALFDCREDANPLFYCLVCLLKSRPLLMVHVERAQLKQKIFTPLLVGCFDKLDKRPAGVLFRAHKISCQVKISVYVHCALALVNIKFATSPRDSLVAVR